MLNFRSPRSLVVPVATASRSSRARLGSVTVGLVCAVLALTVAPALAGHGTDSPTYADTRATAASDAAELLDVKPVRLKALERRVLRRLNEYRREKGRKTLRAQNQLRRAAMAHARAMAAKGFFSHDSADGESFDTRVKRYYGTRGFRSWRVGENLLWSSGNLRAKRAITLWHDSSGHRRNMLERGWRQIGVAAVRMRSASGVFRGFDVTIVVTDFGARS